MRRLPPTGRLLVLLALTACGRSGDVSTTHGSPHDPERIVADPELERQWWIDELGIRDAWRRATGRGVTIALCDAGFYVDEPDLAPNLELEHAFDFSDREHPRRIDDGTFVFHGTAVASLISGVRDGRGTNGIAFDSRLIPMQIFNFDRCLDDREKEEAAILCVRYAARIPDVDIIVLQNQTNEGSGEAYSSAYSAAREATEAGIVVITAAGDHSRELFFEQSYDSGSIIVGALRQDGHAAGFSNFGQRVTVSAFGERIRALHGPGGRMDAFGGTAAATAQVAGVVALMLEVSPGLSPYQVREILERTRLGLSYNLRVGGALNVPAALEEAAATAPDETLQILHANARENLEPLAFP